MPPGYLARAKSVQLKAIENQLARKRCLRKNSEAVRI